MEFYSSASCSSTSDDDVPVVHSLSPTQLLAVAIKKRRSLYNEKHRDYRRELLHTSFIQSLCKHLGEGRAKRRRRGGKKRSHSQSYHSVQCQDSSVPEETKSCIDPNVQNIVECPAKRSCTDEDPFGLDDLFRNIYGPESEFGCRLLTRAPVLILNSHCQGCTDAFLKRQTLRAFSQRRPLVWHYGGFPEAFTCESSGC